MARALTTGDLRKIAAARAIARRAHRTVQEKLFVGVGVVHVMGTTAALLGWIGPIQAAIIHLGPDILVLVNAERLLKVRIKGVCMAFSRASSAVRFHKAMKYFERR